MRKTILVALAAASMFAGSVLVGQAAANHGREADEDCDLSHYVHWIKGARATYRGNGDWRVCLDQGWLWMTGNTNTCTNVQGLMKRAKASRGRAMSVEDADWYLAIMSWYDTQLNRMLKEKGQTSISQGQIEAYCRGE